MVDKTKIWIIKEWQHVYEFGIEKTCHPVADGDLWNRQKTGIQLIYCFSSKYDDRGNDQSCHVSLQS